MEGLSDASSSFQINFYERTQATYKYVRVIRGLQFWKFSCFLYVSAVPVAVRTSVD